MCEAVKCKSSEITPTGYSMRFESEEGLIYTIKINNNTISKLTTLFVLLHKTKDIQQEFVVGVQLPIDVSCRDEDDPFDLSSKNFWVAKKGRDECLISIPGFQQSISVNSSGLFKSLIYIYDQMFGDVPQTPVVRQGALSLVENTPFTFDATLFHFPRSYGVVNACSNHKCLVIQPVMPNGKSKHYVRLNGHRLGVTQYELDADNCWVAVPNWPKAEIARFVTGTYEFKLI